MRLRWGDYYDYLSIITACLLFHTRKIIRRLTYFFFYIYVYLHTYILVLFKLRSSVPPLTVIDRLVLTFVVGMLPWIYILYNNIVVLHIKMKIVEVDR